MKKTFLLFTLLSLTACGEDAPDPLVMRIRSFGVVQTAVHQVEIVLRPVAAAQMFDMRNERMFYGGQVTTRTTMAGEYVITVDEAFIAAHAERTMDSRIVFQFDLPMSNEGQTDDPTISDPSLEVFFRRRGNCVDEQNLCRIARGQRFFPYPLVLPMGGGPVATADVMCISPDHDRECTNNDPFPDAGM
jgi:hypothetical protein